MYSPDAQCSKKSPHVQRIWKLLCIDYCKRLKRWLIDWTILLSWNKQFFPHQGQWIKNLINTYFFHKISQKKLVLDHKSSVVDPNTLNLDPDPGFRPNLDPDPEISWIRIQIRIRNTGWIWNGGLSNNRLIKSRISGVARYRTRYMAILFTWRKLFFILIL